LDLKDILIAFPAEERNIDDTKRDFWIPEKTHTSTKFFSYLDTTQEVEISSKLYPIDHPSLMSIINDKFSQLDVDKLAYDSLENKFKTLECDRAFIRQIDFAKCDDLVSIQVQKNANGQSPYELEQFTDWLEDYVQQTKLWQVRYPERILKISVVDIVRSKDEEHTIGILSKYVTLENLDSLDEKYFIKIDFLYDLEDAQNTNTEDDLDFFETRTFFVQGTTSVDPTRLDDFEFWYRVIILGEDPDDYEDEHDDYNETV
jgi:hypothetical protein